MKTETKPTTVSRRAFVKTAAVMAGTATAIGRIPALAAAAEPANSPKPYRFEFALNAATIRGQKLGPVAQLETAAQAGYTGYEFWLGDLANYRDGGGSLKDLRRRSEDLGIKIINGIGFASWVVDADERRAQGIEQMKREMGLLAELGCSHIAAPPAGANRPGATLDLNRAAERYRALLEIGRQTGVIPQLEIWGSSANLSRLSEAAYVAAQAGHPDACVLADVFHMYRGGSDPAALRVLGRSAVNCFHLNDYPANPPRTALRDSDRIWPGDGVAPFKEILGALADNHCQAMLSLELFNADYYQLPALEAAKTGLAKMKAVVAAAGLA
jgi:sugar phosphate isomerase/epimerase